MSKVSYAVRPIKAEEWEMAMQLVWDTFLIYEAPEFTKEGISHFRDFIRDPRLKDMFLRGDYEVEGAFIKNTMVGVLGTRLHHISLLFVEPEYHHQGIASTLLREYYSKRKALGNMRLSVNASPYAKSFYEKMGFKMIEGEVVKDGIRYYPMVIDF